MGTGESPRGGGDVEGEATRSEGRATGGLGAQHVSMGGTRVGEGWRGSLKGVLGRRSHEGHSRH